MSCHRKPVSRALALPAKGEPQRRTAMVAWGLLASAAVYSGGIGLLQHNQEPAADKGTAKAAPDVEPDMQPGRDPEAGDVYRRDPKEGYVPTYFDGRGGIAGIPLTEEQRQAVVKEALRRGVSAEDAHALAYGEADESALIDKPEVKPPTTGGDYTILAAGPIYREVARQRRRQAMTTPQTLGPHRAARLPPTAPLVFRR